MLDAFDCQILWKQGRERSDHMPLWSHVATEPLTYENLIECVRMKRKSETLTFAQILTSP